jgi:hypothetical protein
VISYAFTVTNTGSVTLTNVTLTDPDATVSGGPIATMAPGASDSTTFTATYTITQSEIDKGTFTNTATTTGNPPSGDPVTDSDSATIAGENAPSISLIKDISAVNGDPSVTVFSKVGDVISYAFTVTNTGNVTLTNVTLTDPDATVSGGPIASLAPGASDNTTFTATYTITQADMDNGVFTNIATVTGTPPTGGSVTDDDDATIEGPKEGASINLSKTANPLNYENVGDIITYTYVATNNGSLTLSKVAVIENAADFTGTGTLPAPVYVPGSSTQGSPEGTLLPGESATYTATYAITQADLVAKFVDNVATATGEDPNENTVTDTDDARVIDPRPKQEGGINLLKTANPKTYEKAGDAITYTYVVTNTGDLTLTKVNVTEAQDDFSGAGSLPKPTYVAGSSTQSSPEGTLKPGESATYRATYTIVQADVTAKSVTNTATATGTNDETTYTDRDTETITATTGKGVDPKPDTPPGGGEMNIVEWVNKVFDWFFELGRNLGLYK